MHVRRLFETLAISTLFTLLGASSASATSVAKKSILRASSSACEVSGKFTAAKMVDGKMRWLFDSIDSVPRKNCPGLPHDFTVVIPSGSYSKLSKSNVYPLSITEPKVGAEVELRLENVPPIGWLLSGDDDALKVRR
jgi:hypothetical protein